MSNMSYVMFENTLSDLEECLYHIEDPLSRDEHNSREELIKLCVEIAKYKNVQLPCEDDEDEDDNEDEEDKENE